MITQKQKIKLKEKLDIKIFLSKGERKTLKIKEELNQNEIYYIIELIKQDYQKELNK